MGRKVRPTTVNVLLAYLVDRRMQYAVDSGTYCALEEVILGITRGDHEAAHAHGEYDDILSDNDKWPWRAKK